MEASIGTYTLNVERGILGVVQLLGHRCFGLGGRFEDVFLKVVWIGRGSDKGIYLIHIYIYI